MSCFSTTSTASMHASNNARLLACLLTWMIALDAQPVIQIHNSPRRVDATAL